ncbi:hypothetical protein KP509_23G027400 [Ceratopteris richardii]|uniref:BHLH domain-containing protein n=1 Tax=Ceratopteris richardii TaxID=49495 RepID=A0A8T2S017_CERRI|nr:hypothetical protein KP509_23G027400 [Ceratopteris richardii]
MAVSGDNSSSSLHSLSEATEPFSNCLAQQYSKPESHSPCDSFLQTLHNPFLQDFTDPPALQECWDSSKPANAHLGAPPGSLPGGSSNGDRISARRLHKADREKLRRDKLNEQFTELASALDPDRPKNDKATILSESVQVVKELRDEVKRLKTERDSLLDESRDLTQENNELREEKVALKNETDQLQNQIQQRLRTSSPWMTMDASMIMSTPAFPYPMPVQEQPISAVQSDSHSMSSSRPLLTPTPYVPLAPPLPPFHMHSNFHHFPLFGNRPGDVGGHPYIHYPPFNGQPINSHSHVERPYAQYPSVQTIPGYVVQIPPNPSSERQPPPRSSSAYKACVPGIPVVQFSPNQGQTKASSHHSSPSQSSSQHSTFESKQDASSAAEQVACSSGSLTPSSLVISKESRNEFESHQIESSSVATAPMHVGEQGLDGSAGQASVFCPATEGTSRVRIDRCASDSAHDPTLRPPAG